MEDMKRGMCEVFCDERIHHISVMTQFFHRLPKSALCAQREASPAIALVALIGTITAIVSLLFESIGGFVLQRTFERIASTNFDFSDEKTMEVTISVLTQVAGPMAKANGCLTLGNVLLLAGGVLVTYALHFGGFRAQWFFWTTLGLALLNLWSPFSFMVPFPYVGPLFGVWWLWCLLWARSEFFPRKVIVIPE
jgi:hypothetical protein